MTKWQGLATTSYYRTAAAVRDTRQSGDVQKATQGIEALNGVIQGIYRANPCTSDRY